MSKIPAVWRAAVGAVVRSVMPAGYADPKSPCQWEGYQPQIYQYFKGEAKEVQVAELKRGLGKVKATGGIVLPGYHAQLGMLHSGLGKDDQMVQELNTEEALFPESTAYIDPLMKNVRKGTN